MIDERTPLKAGKLPGSVLSDLLSELESNQIDPRLLMGPGLGEDSAHIAFGERTLLAKTDPITFTTDEMGWYAVNVNANDIAVSGGEPKWFLATALFPIGSTVEDVRRIFRQLDNAASELGIALAGGHTEVTPAVSQPVVCGFMLGEAPASGAVSSSGANVGDAVVLTKGIAIEGTSIAATEFRDVLKSSGMSDDELDSAARFLHNPGISVLEDARAVIAAGGVTAMHDPTEGGLATALYEMAFASGVDMSIESDAVNVYPECAAICDVLGIDPWGLISSGALLATVSEREQDRIIESLRKSCISAQVIGSVTGGAAAGAEPSVKVLARDGSIAALRRFERDEIARLFEESG